MNIELLITNAGYGFCLLISASLGILVLLKGSKEGRINVVFFLLTMMFCIWQLSYVIGIDLVNPVLSRLAFMFNMATIALIVLNAHVILHITGRLALQRRILKVLYVIAALLIAFYTIFPSEFMSLSVPQLYLPNFFSPGPLYWIGDLFFASVLVYMFAQLLIAYGHADHALRNRLKYFILANLYGYGVGVIPEFLLYGYKVDPILACLTGLYTIPMAYAIIRYDAIDLNLLAKRAMGYALGVGAVTAFILLIGYGNDSIVAVVPEFPRWLLPLLSAAAAVGVGYFVWRKIKEADVLKFQFVDVVTHKFSTPLTHIKWSLENLRTLPLAPEAAEAVGDMEGANSKLVELTNTLVGMSGSDDSQYLYTFQLEKPNLIVGETLAAVADRADDKKVSLVTNVPETLPAVSMDHKRVQFAFQMIIDNAITYSPEGDTVEIAGITKGSFLILSVRDHGIGITKDDLPHLFSKFFRGSNAVKAHTEGLGIGLYLSRDILKRHGGDMWAESDGPGTGSAFFIKLPLPR